MGLTPADMQVRPDYPTYRASQKNAKKEPQNECSLKEYGNIRNSTVGVWKFVLSFANDTPVLKYET